MKRINPKDFTVFHLPRPIIDVCRYSSNDGFASPFATAECFDSKAFVLHNWGLDYGGLLAQTFPPPVSPRRHAATLVPE